MFKRNDPTDRSPSLTPVRTVVAVMLLAPVMAWSVVTTVATPAAPATSASAPAGSVIAGKPVGGYQIRCWQYGRLLFEENHVSLPDSRDYGLRISGKDRNGQPLYIAETQNATCLVRPEAEPRGAPLNGMR